ncbi:MAG: glycoside hydrolase family 43 protein [Bacteroidales bacterium]|nr:glycoside hydrolase family 43 protein [Bacteroidales bacterium]
MKRILLLGISFWVFLVCATAQNALSLADINIRDPFIYADETTQTYYMYSSVTSKVSSCGGSRGGVMVYKSKDLKSWNSPTEVMVLPEDNWITGKIWAPEMHCYKGKYYLFATVNTDLIWKGGLNGGCSYTWRGTQIFWSDSPEGPFQTFDDKMPVTPFDEMALDGTLWVENGKPYMCYCHEWIQANDGEVKLLPLKEDLSGADGLSVRLFCASAAPWVEKKNTMVTDGPFLYRNKVGRLLMIWSSFTGSGYAVGLASSVTGKVVGPWKQHEQPLYTKHGGHAMLFRDFSGQLHMVLHAPNSPGGAERAVLLDVEETADGLEVRE